MKTCVQSNAKDLIYQGIQLVAETVGSTLGPNGQLVAIADYNQGKPHITKDGVTVAKNINVKPYCINVGVQLLKEAALKQLSVGDGTTTTTVLAGALVKYAYNELNKGIKPAIIKQNINKFTELLLKHIESITKPIESINDLKEVATISANNDVEIGQLIADAFEKISKDGVITLEESQNCDTTIDIVKGMRFDRGYTSPYFCTDNLKNIVELNDVYLMITNQKINRIKDIINTVEYAYKENKPLLIIAEDFDSEVINNLAVNLAQGLKVCCVKCPSFGDYRLPVLEDLAILTDAKLATYENTIEPKDFTPDMLGFAKKVIVTKENTTIIDGRGSVENVQKRADEIKYTLETYKKDAQNAEFMVNYYQTRIARLLGGVAVIYVGGVTELEMKERKDRIEDAIAATKAAIEEGVVIGAGKSMLLTLDSELQPISEAFAAPYNMIYNSFEDKSLFNPDKIIDPAKTIKMAIKNAVSVTELFLNINFTIIPDYD